MFLEVHREWSSKPPYPHAAPQSAQSATYATKKHMMERWQQEEMREQPYNDIAAVKVTERGGTDGGTGDGYQKASKSQQLNATSERSETKSG